jgi:hypothetical protein
LTPIGRGNLGLRSIDDAVSTKNGYRYGSFVTDVRRHQHNWPLVTGSIDECPLRMTHRYAYRRAFHTQVFHDTATQESRSANGSTPATSSSRVNHDRRQYDLEEYCARAPC